MPPELKTIVHKCQRCGRAFTSLMRLQHHRAAEHAPRTSRDTPTTGDIRHRPQSHHKPNGGPGV